MFGPKIKIDREMYERLRTCAQAAGYSSVDEFVLHVLEKEIDRVTKGDSDAEAAKKRLKGLGYIS
jgi:hypothetical protein